jgi:hypothetical protein
MKAKHQQNLLAAALIGAMVFGAGCTTTQKSAVHSSDPAPSLRALPW